MGSPVKNMSPTEIETTVRQRRVDHLDSRRRTSYGDNPGGRIDTRSDAHLRRDRALNMLLAWPTLAPVVESREGGGCSETDRSAI